MSIDPNKKVKVIFGCLDWRLHPHLENFFAADDTGCDMCVTAGSVKSLVDPLTRDFMLSQIEVSKNLHNCQAVILTMHIDCGAYGGSKAYNGAEDERSACMAELRKAKEIVRTKFLDLNVDTYLIGLERSVNGWSIKPEKVQIEITC